MRGFVWHAVVLLLAAMGVAHGFVAYPAGLGPTRSIGSAPAVAASAGAGVISPPSLRPLQVARATDLHAAAVRLGSAAVRWGLQRSLLADDVLLALVSPEAFWLLREWRTQTFGEQESMRRVLDSARQSILRLRAEHPELRGARVTVREKGLWSTFHKATVRRKQVHDVLAIRVVLRGADEQDCYAALDAIRLSWPSVGAARFKDYVRFPKANGYQGLHDTLELPCGRPFEIQIRTDEMHAHAEYGPASHRKYKGAGLYRLSARLLEGFTSGIASSPPPTLMPLVVPVNAKLA